MATDVPLGQRWDAFLPRFVWIGLDPAKPGEDKTILEVTLDGMFTREDVRTILAGMDRVAESLDLPASVAGPASLAPPDVPEDPLLAALDRLEEKVDHLALTSSQVLDRKAELETQIMRLPVPPLQMGDGPQERVDNALALIGDANDLFLAILGASRVFDVTALSSAQDVASAFPLFPVVKICVLRRDGRETGVGDWAVLQNLYNRALGLAKKAGAGV